LHAFPQAPQFAGSVATSTQFPPQICLLQKLTSGLLLPVHAPWPASPTNTNASRAKDFMIHPREKK
jgi:hypothetical protein